LINIRQTAHHHTLEELRVLPALLCGAIVISESAPLQDTIGYSEFILWATIDDLPELIKDVATHYERYRQPIFGGARFVQCMRKLDQKNRLTAAKIADFIVNLP
jgi:hypothetical protein